MQKISKSVPYVKVPGRWLTSFLVDYAELPLRKKWDLLSTRAVQLSSRVLEKVIIRNRNRTVAMLYPCLTHNLKSMDVSILPMTILTKLLSYMRLIYEHSLGGALYFPIMTMSSAWLEVSKALTRSVNATYFGRLWLCLRCRSVLL